MKKRYLLTCWLLTLLLHAKANQDTISPLIKTSDIEHVRFLPDSLAVYIDTSNIASLQNIRISMFRRLDKLPRKSIPKSLMIDSKVYLLFRLENNETSTRSFYVTPGIYSSETVVYSMDSVTKQWIKIKGQVTGKAERAYRLVSIQPGDKMDILIQCKYIRTNIVTLNAYLLNPAFFDHYINYIQTHWFGVNTFTFVLCGLLLMMLLFSLANYAQNYKREYLYYSIYALCMGLLLFLKAVYYKHSTGFSFFYEEYFDYALQMIGYIFYIGFTRMFLNTPGKYPTLNRMFVIAEIVLAVFLLAFTIFYYAGYPYRFLSATENASKFFLIFLGIMYIILGIVERNRLMNYLLGGNVANLVMGGISQFMISFPAASFLPTKGIFRQSLVYFEVGIFLELVLFLLGLTYKNKIELIEKVKMDEAIRQEGEKQEYQKQIAVLSAQQDERSRISADMHDELGSGVTAIRLLSEIARQKTKDKPVEEISKISYNANELMTKMNAIIWSMNPGNDSVNGLVAYIRSYASEYLENFDIQYHIIVPSEIPERDVSGVKRRNIFLVLKESLNNIMKHANASEVTVTIQFNHQMLVEINDNGKGIDEEKLNQFGNGLKNMQRRMESIGGSFNISSNNGTTTKLEIPI